MNVPSGYHTWAPSKLESVTFWLTCSSEGGDSGASAAWVLDLPCHLPLYGSQPC